ncbi:MarR family winged helix-turn-helix transcriptional regulator [Patulibacter defluvii]|uniref:MarR family winged helix-turn-helix transcriptional regulator n=1 Tax=Patulibacter defluvii TaxID=3095358 RepID=UPI002A75000A|nr:MarR family transcriptional regulator [Patulibacter sp. DM4]
MSGPPAEPPIGLQLSRTARAASQAFERALAAAGGTTATWQVLLLVRSRNWGTQSELAKAMGVTAATLTHHLSALEQRGLIVRERQAENRRIQQVALTAAGEAMFDQLRGAALAHDQRLRAALDPDELTQLRTLLARLDAALATP